MTCASPTIEESGRNPVDGHVNATRDALAGSTRPVPLEELHLQMIERIEIRQPMSNRLAKCVIRAQQLALSGDVENALDGPFTLGRDAAENQVPALGIPDELGVARSDSHVGLGQNHFEVVDEHSEK